MSEARHPGPLSGLRVVDLTRVLGGPFCTQWLGDMGAEIIKVEPPQGDETRAWGPPFDGHGTASYFIGVNRSKQAISVDLSREKG
ncbi:MAG: CoA transferase, partial [Hyphomicrobiales bacterium]